MVVVGAHELYMVDVSIRKYNAYGSEGFMSGGRKEGDTARAGLVANRRAGRVGGRAHH